MYILYSSSLLRNKFHFSSLADRTPFDYWNDLVHFPTVRYPSITFLYRVDISAGLILNTPKNKVYNFVEILRVL